MILTVKRGQCAFRPVSTRLTEIARIPLRSLYVHLPFNFVPTLPLLSVNLMLFFILELVLFFIFGPILFVVLDFILFFVGRRIVGGSRPVISPANPPSAAISTHDSHAGTKQRWISPREMAISRGGADSREVSNSPLSTALSFLRSMARLRSLTAPFDDSDLLNMLTTTVAVFPEAPMSSPDRKS